jgi:hypothetical protein
MDAVGNALIVTDVVAVLLQAPLVKEYVMVYVPAVLAARLITPVAAVMETPAGAL